ncbi:MAG: hypothetical protein C0519_02250 [Hyphomicrobium sp.]|nr:hypothetical protein [Hyphomicrobium sp.]PPD09400.1 MAG: hypothetical protein CTY28_00850 [Hyphomicrobium sp.]
MLKCAQISRMVETLKQCVSSRDGIIAVEFGLIAPIILALVLGVVEVSRAIENYLSIQTATRAGTHYALTKPPVQGDMSRIVSSVRAALPPDWVSATDGSAPQITASMVCECDVTGPAACGAPCGIGEKQQTYIRVEVQKLYTPLVSFRNFAPSYQLKTASMVRLK